MAEEEFSNKLKTLKTKSKRTSKIPPKQLKLALIVIVLFIIIFEAYNLYYVSKTKELQELDGNKQVAIDTINALFSKYPHDTQKAVFIGKIKQKDNIEDINKIIDEARDYIELKKYKEDAINQIKNSYGKYYNESTKAQELVRKITMAKTQQEVDELFRESNIENEVRTMLNEKLMKKLSSDDEYYYIKMGDERRFMSKEDFVEFMKSLSISQLKELSVEPVSQLSKLTIVVSAKQCGKIPLSGDTILIYNKKDLQEPPEYAIVDSAYVILPSIGYSEQKSASSTASDNGDTTSISSSSSISYSLDNLPGVLHATAADKLDYETIREKFGRYGEKLNKIEEDTQIFDENVDYLLIIIVPSEQVPNLISHNSEDLYIVQSTGGSL